VAATVALYLPSSLLVYGVARLWGRWRGSVWHTAVERGLAPVAAGFLLSGGIAVLRISPGGPAVWAAAIIATVMLLRWPRLHPLVLFAASGALFGLAALW
jgi:chromate transporter